MLERKHLSPWLLIYLIISILHSLLTIQVLIIITLNDLSGFNIGTISLTAFTSCKPSTIYKFYYFMKIILQVCLVLSLFNIILSIVQFIFLLVHFIKFKSNSSNAGQYENFPQLTKFKLNILYILNCTGLFCAVPIFGNLLMFFIQFGKCTLSSQDKSSIFLIPVLISGGVLLLQVILIFLLMKITYNFNTSIKSQQQEEQLDQYNQSQIKRKILQINSPNDIQLMRMSPYLKNSSYSTNQSNPRQLKSNLLNKSYSNYDTNGNNLNQSIYNTSNNLNGNHDTNQNYAKNGNTLSPNSVSSQQKQILKKIPKYPYKTGKNNMNPNDIIFQQPNNEQGSQTYQNGNTQQTDPNTKSSTINRKQFPPLPKSPYANSHYLKNLENKFITPQQRRKIKIPYLSIASGIIEFDSSNYTSDLMLQEQNLQSNFGRKKSGPNNIISSNWSIMINQNQILLNSARKIQGQLNLQTQNQMNFANSPQSQMNKRKYSESNNNSPNSRKRYAKKKLNRQLNLSSYLKQKKAKEQKNKQDENPINSYVQQDQNYENQINNITQFETLNKRRKKGTHSNYFQEGKQSQKKLYLHKNKHGQKEHGRNKFQFEDQRNGFDAFQDQAFEDQIYTQRMLLNNKQDASNQQSNGSSLDLKGSAKLQSKKSIRQNDSLNLKNVKKGSKKDAMLLDYIRSKNQHQS